MMTQMIPRSENREGQPVYTHHARELMALVNHVNRKILIRYELGQIDDDLLRLYEIRHNIDRLIMILKHADQEVVNLGPSDMRYMKKYIGWIQAHPQYLDRD